MLAKFQVFSEVHNRWPAKNGKPGGESFNLLVIDVTKPSQYALRALYHYRLTEEEKVKHWGKLEGKTIDIGVNEISNGEKTPLLRGTIVTVPEK